MAGDDPTTTPIFISYARDDVVAARAVHSAFAERGLRSWRDERWLAPGDDFALEITRAIRECEAFVLLLSAASNSSDYVFKEVAIAYHFRKAIIPVLIDASDPADHLLPYVVRLQSWNLATRSAADLAAHLAAKNPRAPAEAGVPAVEGRKGEAVTAEIPGSPPPGSRGLVSNSDYLEFLQHCKHTAPQHWRSRDPRFHYEEGAAPVTRVSWDDAVEFCDWAGGCLPCRSDESSSQARAATVYPAALGEWRDAGTEQLKQVVDSHTARLIAMLDRTACQPEVGFRCVPVGPPAAHRWVFLDGGWCELGTDLDRFSRVASIHRLPRALTRPILGRQVRRFDLSGFSMAAACVTNELFYAFTQAAGKPWPSHWHAKWLSGTARPFPARLASQPVVNISVETAQEYCIWSRTRLPLWFEWERAAAGTARRPYPWGASYAAECCNSAESERGSTVAVDEYPQGATPEGVWQLCGNIGEWVVGPDGRPEVRGGSYRAPCEVWGLAYAFRQAAAGFRGPDVGFRVVLA